MADADSLGVKASRGATATGLGQLVRVGVQVLGVLVMARLLVPADFGLVAMVTAIVGFGQIFRDFGLSMAAVQFRDFSIQQRSNLFWVNSAIGLLLAVIFFSASWSIAAAYGDKRLISISQILAITFLLNGLGSQYRANLQRQLRFGALAVSEVVALLAGIVSAIVLALMGASYWAIVAQQIVQALTALAVTYWQERWKPMRYRRGHNTRNLVTFGWHIMGQQLVNYASKNIDTVIIGAQFGAVPLGYYNRAFQLLTVPINQLAHPLIRVAVATLSRIQDDKVRFNSYIRKAQRAVLSIMLPILTLLFILVVPVVHLVLGSQWSDSVTVFRYLSIAGAFEVLSFTNQWIFISTGRARSYFRLSLAVRPLVVCGVIVGSFFSVESVALGYALGTVAIWPIELYWLSKNSFVRVKVLATDALVLLVSTFAIGAAAHFSLTRLPALYDIVTLIIGVLIFAVLSLILMAVCRPYREFYEPLAQIIRRTLINERWTRRTGC